MVAGTKRKELPLKLLQDEGTRNQSAVSCHYTATGTSALKFNISVGGDMKQLELSCPTGGKAE